MYTFDIFVTVVRLGSFAAAAKALHRSPSAISKQIGLLEQKLNVQLIDRTTRSLAVTDAGKVYFERFDDISKRISDAEIELKELSGEPSGTLNITWPNSLSCSKIVEVLHAFTQAHANITVNVDITNSILDLADENTDFAFRLGPLGDSPMVAIELFTIEPVICAAPEFVAKYGIPKKLSALAKIPHVLPSYTNITQKSRLFFPEMKGFNVNEHHLVNDIYGLYSMTMQGMGAGFLFRHMIARELADGSLIDLTPDNKLPELPVNMMYHRLNYTPKKNRVFIDYFKSHFRK